MKLVIVAHQATDLVVETLVTWDLQVRPANVVPLVFRAGMDRPGSVDVQARTASPENAGPSVSMDALDPTVSPV